MKKFGFLIGMVFFYCVSVLAQGPTPKTSAPKTFDGGVEFTVATTQTTCGSSTGTATINVVAGTPTTYVWYDELDNEIATGVSLIENLASGNYYVVVGNTANCTSQQTFNIDASDVNPTTIALTSVDDNVCFGSEVVITATSVDATAYQWYNDGVLIDGQTSEILTTTDLPVGTNSITARSQQGTCWSPLSDPIEIVVNSAVEFTVATTQTTCGSNTGTATINVVAGTPTTYVWYDELDNEIATGVSLVENLASGNYYVVVVNAANCSSQQIFSIDASDVNPTTIALTSVDDNVCFGSEVVITATSVDATAYQWYNDGVLIDGQTSEILTTTDLPVGTNSITARSQQGTCWSPLSDPIEIVVNGYPTFTISDDMPETICGDEIVTYTITVTGGTPNYTVSLVESSHPYIMVSPYDQTNVTVTVDGGQAIFSVRLQNPPNAGEQVIGFTTSYIVVDQNGCYEP